MNAEETKTVITIDLSDIDSVAEAISQGITTPEMLANAFPEDLEVLDGAAVLAISPIYADDGNHEVGYSSYEYTAKTAAKAYVDNGDWGTDNKTYWIPVSTYRKGVDEDGDIVQVDEERHTIRIDPEEPNCVDGNEHQWKSPHSILGGLKENPGVWGSGGGVIIFEACMLCGCKKTTDTWAQNPGNGQQGLTSVEYEEGVYESEVMELLIAKAKEQLGEDEVDLEDHDENDARSYDFLWQDPLGSLMGCDDSDLIEYGIRLRVEGDDADQPGVEINKKSDE